jgi:hypothetical protein
MTKKNQKIPFAACDKCVEEYLTKSNDSRNDSIVDFNKCPFKFKPNLKIPIRRKYRMKCFCGEKFNCPAEITRYKGKPYCGSCLGDAINSDQDDGYCPSAEDDQREVNRWLVDRYGEC